MAQAKRQAEAVRRRLINLRVSAEDRNVIDRAAKTAGKTRTEFMIEASRKAAHDTLLDTNLVVVDGPTFKRFKKLLDAPGRPNDRLLGLINLKPPWES
jgi:uncharacterized protein (DUF1778 family)